MTRYRIVSPLSPPLARHRLTEAGANVIAGQVGNVIARYPAVAEEVEDDLRRGIDGGATPEAAQLAAVQFLLRCAERGLLPEAVDRALRRAWRRVTTPEQEPIDLLNQNALSGSVVAFDAYRRHDQIEASRLRLPERRGGPGNGISIKVTEGDTPEVDPLATRALEQAQQRHRSAHPIPRGVL